MNAFLPTIVLLTLVAGARPEDVAPPQRPWPLLLSSEPFARLGNKAYLPSTLDLLAREPEWESLGEMKWIVPDILGTVLNYVGEHAAARERDARMMAQFGGGRGKSAAPDLSSFTAKPAVAEILAAAHGRRVVMFDEEHRSSEQRAFLHRVLEGLRKDGFTHLACETLAEDAALEKRGWPTVDSGTYSRDPVYGDLLRRAVALGFHIAKYEADDEVSRPRPDDKSPTDPTNRRERSQAENLAKLLADPSARVVVFAGRHHISEAEGGEWTPMAGIFKQLTSVDPLTVDLFVLVDPSRRADAHPAWRAAVDAGLVKDEPVVLVGADGACFSALPGSIDLFVFQPPLRFVEDRPAFLSCGGLREPFWPELDVDALDEPVIVQALFSGEDDSAVPADQVIARKGERMTPLLLRAGNYRVRALDRAGVVKWETTATIGK